MAFVLEIVKVATCSPKDRSEVFTETVSVVLLLLPDNGAKSSQAAPTDTNHARVPPPELVRIMLCAEGKVSFCRVTKAKEESDNNICVAIGSAILLLIRMETLAEP